METERTKLAKAILTMFSGKGMNLKPVNTSAVCTDLGIDPEYADLLRILYAGGVADMAVRKDLYDWSYKVAIPAKTKQHTKIFSW